MPQVLFAPGEIRSVNKGEGATLAQIDVPQGPSIVVTIWHCEAIAARIFPDAREATRFIEKGWAHDVESAD